MDQKRIALYLCDNTKNNEISIAFINTHFSDCFVDCFYIKQPTNLLNKRIGDHFKTLISSGKHYYTSSNVFKLIDSSIFEEQSVVRRLSYYDLLALSSSSGLEWLNKVRKSEKANRTPIPTLVIPQIELHKIEQTVFVSTNIDRSVALVKKYVYLFAEKSEKMPLVFVTNVHGYDEIETENEKMLLEYIKSKKIELSTYTMHKKLVKDDLQALNSGSSTLFLLDENSIKRNGGTIEISEELKDFCTFFISI